MVARTGDWRRRCHNLGVKRIVVMSWIQVLRRILVALRRLIQVVLLLLLLIRVIACILVRACHD